MSFGANGHGARGRNAYKFQMRFYQPVDDETATFTVTDHKIELLIRKAEPAWWVRLVATPQKPHWLRVDFDRWRTEDDAELNEPARDVREDYVEEYNNLQKQEIGYVRGKKDCSQPFPQLNNLYPFHRKCQEGLLDHL